MKQSMSGGTYVGRVSRMSICLAVLLVVAVARADDSAIRVNTIGFLPEAPKCASVITNATPEFRVLSDPDGREVFAGRAGEAKPNADTGESIAVADFSAVRAPGLYRLDVSGVGRSAPFRIGADVYSAPFKTAARAMYLWRCGTAVKGEHDGDTFAHAACHTADAWCDFVGGGHVKKDVTGGWHDAGDYNKYVVNAGFSLGVLFQAWYHFGDQLKDVRLDIPESDNRIPDFLDELRWEVNWLRSMQADDGRVYHKVSTKKFGGFVMPEDENAERYLTSWSSAATADFVAVMAMASRHFAPHDPRLARACLAEARRSYAFLLAHPADHRADLTGFDTGPYQANDASRRLWASVELWETTGDPQFLDDFERGAGPLERKFDPTAGWANVKNLAMYTYVLSHRTDRDPDLLHAARAALVDTADEIVRTRDAHGYARPLGAKYYWGSNGDVAQQVQTLYAANEIQPNRAYVEASLDALNYLLGRNPYGRSFVTGVGHRPPLRPHDRRSGADNVVAPWPGYLVGGGWPKATDWKDEQGSYQTNEIAINWNATLIYALARFVK